MTCRATLVCAGDGVEGWGCATRAGQAARPGLPNPAVTGHALRSHMPALCWLRLVFGCWPAAGVRFGSHRLEE